MASAARIVAALALAALAACETPRPAAGGIERYFQALPDPTGENVSVTLEVLEVDEAERHVLDVAWQNTSDETAPAPVRANGLRVAAAAPTLRAEIDLARSRSATCRYTRQEIAVLNGRTATLRICEALPAPVTVVLHDGRLEARSLLVSRAAASLEVRPERIGPDRIRLDLIPVLLSPDAPGGVATLTDARTAVEVPRGVPVVIGAQEQESRTFGGTFLSSRTAREHRRRILLVSAR